MKVFSKKMYQQISASLACWPGAGWADECDGKPVVDGKCDGYMICDNWCIEVPDPVEDAEKKEREDLWAKLNAYDWKPVLEAEKKPAPEAVNCRCVMHTGKQKKRFRIVIDCDGDTTTARMLVDGHPVKKTTATRNPSDNFSWRIGAQTAFNRLWAKKKKKETEEQIIEIEYEDINGNKYVRRYSGKELL